MTQSRQAAQARQSREAAPTRPDRAPSWPDARAVNEAIRQYVSAHGRRPWGATERTELDRLRAAWLAAVRGKPHAPARP